MKILLASVVITLFSLNSLAQVKPALTAKIKTPNARCEECKTKIETYLKRYDGIISINVNFRKGETTVKYVTDRINIEEIKTAIANVGFDADDVPANPDFYKLLPKCCKKPEDGGLPPVKSSGPAGK
ncbi:MAG: heavy-metal-associated domain-containing protein [Bacteroidetes bacterium]|nr:heavy-metal-associated domain-containing protein [Bacteroidota bacterium]MBS1633952.1 heavy-metal-associated domain-containing protein [Bacteroidota bacterium]